MALLAKIRALLSLQKDFSSFFYIIFETMAQILAMRLAEAAGDLANIKFFFHLLAHTQKKGRWEFSSVQ